VSAVLAEGLARCQLYFRHRDVLKIQDREKKQMLVLSRKAGERILIGDDVAITVVRIGPNSVRIGIEAPKSMNIVREELIDFGSGRNAATVKPESLPL